MPLAPRIPDPVSLTPYTLALRFLGLKEVAGLAHNPMILAWLRLDNAWPGGDEVPWCSAFVSWICWTLGVSQRSKSLAARSWSTIGTAIDLEECEPGWDIVVLKRGGSDDPSVAGPGHVGFYHSHDADHVTLLGGNQSNGVNTARFSQSDVLAVRRLV